MNVVPVKWPMTPYFFCNLTIPRKPLALKYSRVPNKPEGLSVGCFNGGSPSTTLVHHLNYLCSTYLAFWLLLFIGTHILEITVLDCLQCLMERR